MSRAFSLYELKQLSLQLQADITLHEFMQAPHKKGSLEYREHGKLLSSLRKKLIRINTRIEILSETF